MTVAQTIAIAAQSQYQASAIAVAVVSHGKLIDSTPATLHLKFGIGSLTKQFVAAEVLLLEQRHKLRLDQTVGTYFGNGPASSVTLREGTIVRFRLKLWMCWSEPACRPEMP